MKSQVDGVVVSWQQPREGSHGQNLISRLAGMIQLCRPGWSTGVTCHAAHSLLNDGVREFREVDSLVGYLRYLEMELVQYDASGPDAPLAGGGCELEVQGWYLYWKLYRDRTSASCDSLPPMMQQAR